jgi:hypothetical protein
VLFTLRINRNGRDNSIVTKEFAIDHQHQQILGNGPINQLGQLLDRRGFPIVGSRWIS